ncbi:MAG: hypothetical protein K2Q07_10800 [Burkholderiaceae bacterium]|nr:hypothetical protein [Burkholderiaceae bacterium]
MSWIVTAAGDELNLQRPAPGHITALSVAWSLSQINRFNGHAIRPYSVAEHSLLVCEIAERELGLDIFGQLGALLHDAHEFACGDMHTPGKAEIGTAWCSWEARWAIHTRAAFAVLAISATHRTAIKRADLIALATERRDLLHPLAIRPWPCLDGVEPVTWVNLYDDTRRRMGWEDWRDRFLDRYHELDFARNERLDLQPH